MVLSRNSEIPHPSDFPKQLLSENAVSHFQHPSLIKVSLQAGKNDYQKTLNKPRNLDSIRLLKNPENVMQVDIFSVKMLTPSELMMLQPQSGNSNPPYKHTASMKLFESVQLIQPQTHNHLNPRSGVPSKLSSTIHQDPVLNMSAREEPLSKKKRENTVGQRKPLMLLNQFDPTCDPGHVHLKSAQLVQDGVHAYIRLKQDYHSGENVPVRQSTPKLLSFDNPTEQLATVTPHDVLQCNRTYENDQRVNFG